MLSDSEKNHGHTLLMPKVLNIKHIIKLFLGVPQLGIG